MMENFYLIDWLSFTIPVQDLTDLRPSNVRAFLRSLGLAYEFEEREQGRYGYNRSLNFLESINVLYNDFYSIDTSNEKRVIQAMNMGIHIEFSGQGCRYLESSIGEDWRGFFALINSLGVKYSRLDIALDDYKQMLKFNQIEDKVRDGEVISLSRKRDITETVEVSKQEKFDNKGRSKGKTIYFGTRSSSIYIRFYDKKKEQENKGIEVKAKSWQRYEIVLRKEKAEDFISRFCEGETFDSLYLGVLSGAIRFVEQGTDTNKARWQSSPFWLEFLKGIESIKLKSHEVTPEIGKTIDWIDVSVLRSLKLLSKVAKEGDIDLYQIIENSNKEISERHKMLFNSFDLLTEEEKNDIFDKIKAIGLI